jgi:hypothetical protein
MHPEIEQDHPGNCPKCGMALVPKGSTATHAEQKSWVATYQPLLVIIGLILLAAATVSFRRYQAGTFSLASFMQAFMAGFFLVFSGFKLLDLRGFADGYATYDLLARRWRGYGFIYAFIELYLGLAYLGGFALQTAAWITLVVMTFSGLGVLKSMAEKRPFQCACLGTIIKVPLTTVTLVEDFGMALMAAVVLLKI